MTATHRERGTGIGKTITLNLGLIIASTPPRAKTAPDAPTAIDKGAPRSIYKTYNR